MKLFKKPRLPEACNPELPEQLAQNCAVEFLEDLHSTFSTYRTLLGRSLAQYKSRMKGPERSLYVWCYDACTVDRFTVMVPFLRLTTNGPLTGWGRVAFG